MVCAQTLLIRQPGSPGKSPAVDTVFAAGNVVVEFRPPQGWERDTFVAVVRSPLGIVARKLLLPAARHTGVFHLPKPGLYLITLHHRRRSAHLWALRRLYVLAPPYTTVPALKAYHNALVARTPPPPVPPAEEKDLQEALETLHSPLPGAADLAVPLKEEDLTLPETNLEEPALPASEGTVPDLDEEDLSD